MTHTLLILTFTAVLTINIDSTTRTCRQYCFALELSVNIDNEY